MWVPLMIILDLAARSSDARRVTQALCGMLYACFGGFLVHAKLERYMP